MIKEQVSIINRLGLHARAAAKLVSTASNYESRVEIAKEDRVVDGKSIMAVMMLAASCGTDIKLIIHGADEEQARDAIVALIADRFGEGE
ncbi:HPr family phosphocarrier protein [Hydrocarboniclastica marina]|uniref:HPr family phosphocarrier protein n=1 Tax=Hydrocarboniclastica marina TaxID=2259620 RepID=A0A4P7XHS3_9ALTE|nr:HPr family phosphocarrier protein [Hydrocarboniclastica marina]MAL97983.1 phosphocarrier protein HPr [Alteromonadaceae bacterium]QCF26576.1 HPr family phosphocarrier protein [Hydrocarboniclastica marina]|tara:strand:- start:1070 stop:1339 length:270 start_codon:yes stop_codon:yes gene_type:complete